MSRVACLLASVLLAAAPVTQAREQYLLLNYSTSLNAPREAQDMMGHVRDTFGAANRQSRLKAGLAIIYTPKAAPGLAALAGSPVRLRFEMSDADLYSIHFTPPS